VVVVVVLFVVLDLLVDGGDECVEVGEAAVDVIDFSLDPAKKLVEVFVVELRVADAFKGVY